MVLPLTVEKIRRIGIEGDAADSGYSARSYPKWVFPCAGAQQAYNEQLAAKSGNRTPFARAATNIS